MAGSTDLDYFVCTLGEAVDHDIPRPFNDVNHLIEQQASNNPDLPAVGFYRPDENDTRNSFTPEVLTFEQVYHTVSATAARLKATLSLSPDEAVGLLCQSSPEFLFAWLACIRLGHPVLLIAPQCSSAGIAGLCHETGVSVLLVDGKYAELGDKAAQQSCNGGISGLRCQQIPFTEEDLFSQAWSNSREVVSSPSVKNSSTTAYFHHTSGTSSGSPKPIPQTHHGAVECLPALDGGSCATFTTTPLYHGGPADTFRAWTSNAMIWLFPSSHVPITSTNIAKCLECSQQSVRSGLSPPIRYFASVPYVLEMMSENQQGIETLKDMDLVGVGGAALSSKLGDHLVSQGVRLVSRFGSAECGFMLSSHRDYKKDTAWQYLRIPLNAAHLGFELYEEGLSELIVSPGWPHMAKRNREDGGYATFDLFEHHEHIPNAWKYHSRADAQVTLSTGKKFSPELLESAIVASSDHISHALVFGNDKPYPGVLLFRNKAAASLADKEMMEVHALLIDDLNEKGDAHSRIAKEMLIPMPYSEQPLETSSKGTVIRKAAEAQYTDAIEGAYRTHEINGCEDVSDDELPNAVHSIVCQTLQRNENLSNEMDLFAFGVDSIASMRIRQKLQQLLPKDASPLQVSVVEDCGNIKLLSEHLKRLRDGDADEVLESRDSVHDYMRRLVDEYSEYDRAALSNGHHQGRNAHEKGEIIVLTGATGFLGAHVLHQLRNSEEVATIYILVRGQDDHAALERVSKALQQRHLPPLSNSDDSAKIKVVRCNLSEPRLGLDQQTYTNIARECTVILHLAWSVNFRLKLQHFVKDSIASVRNVIDLALASGGARVVYCSSTASVAAHSEPPIPEAILDDPVFATELGYSQSKWVAEQICSRANLEPELAARISVLRVGQLCGDSLNGVWNSKEAWPMMLSSVKLTNTLPDLQGQVLDWLPVDVAASAVVEAAMLPKPQDRPRLVLHVLNDSGRPTWTDLLQWLKKQRNFELIPPADWIRRLENDSEQGSHHPSLQLLHHWKAAYAEDAGSQSKETDLSFAMEQSRASLTSLRAIRPIDEEFFERLWAWIDENL